jgi:hypothetical protein
VNERPRRLRPRHPAARGPARALFLLALLGAPGVARAHKDDYLGDTFVFLTLDRRELELEYYLDGISDPRALGHRLGVEYGITDHLMGDVAASWTQLSGGPTTFQEGFVELRYRFGEENAHVVDPAASIEYRVERDADGETRRFLQPRIVLSRDFGDTNVTLNVAWAIDLASLKESAPEFDLGIRSPRFGIFRAGLELRRETAVENVTEVIPQLWARFSESATLKAGVGKNFAGERGAYVRIALELEF